jgi:hypothetical protein
MKRLVCRALSLALKSTPLVAPSAPNTAHAEQINTRAAGALHHYCLVAVETTDDRQLQGLGSETQTDH